MLGLSIHSTHCNAIRRLSKGCFCGYSYDLLRSLTMVILLPRMMQLKIYSYNLEKNFLSVLHKNDPDTNDDVTTRRCSIQNSSDVLIIQSTYVVCVHFGWYAFNQYTMYKISLYKLILYSYYIIVYRIIVINQILIGQHLNKHDVNDA